MNARQLIPVLLIAILATPVTSFAKTRMRNPASRPNVMLTHYNERPSATSTSGNLGLGVMFGEPTGLTLKDWLSNSTAFDVGLTYSFSNYVEILADYLWHFPGAFSSNKYGSMGSEFIPYVGVGAEMFFDTEGNNGKVNSSFNTGNRSNAGFGARVPLGVEYLPRKVPLGVFAEIAPGLALAPSVYGFFEGVVGIRFYL